MDKVKAQGWRAHREPAIVVAPAARGVDVPVHAVSTGREAGAR